MKKRLCLSSSVWPEISIASGIVEHGSLPQVFDFPDTSSLHELSGDPDLQTGRLK